METGLTPEFSIVAIIAAYNEADIIGQLVSDLIAQGIDVYFLDDGSTDGTMAAVEPFAGRGVIGLEQFAPPDAESTSFHWERILRRKSELAAALDGEWFIHHDADEFRESPWRGLSLANGIRRVDALGYNAIDFASFDFRPVDDLFRPGDDPRMAFQFYTPHAPYDRVQVRCWKKSDHPVDLASSGGHEAKFTGRRVFPLRFISRHYPIRSQAHGERKVFEERQRRYLVSERGRGWHVQYDDFRPGDTFLSDPSMLIRYDPDAVRVELALRHRGIEELEAAIEAIRADAERSLAKRDRELAARECELAELRQFEARTRGELVKAHTALAEAADHAMRIEAALAAAHTANAEGQAHLQAVTSELAAHRQSLESATRQLHDVHQSWSWRLTAPVRGLLRRFKGR
jgi:Glycosyl transferase family 2